MAKIKLKLSVGKDEKPTESSNISSKTVKSSKSLKSENTTSSLPKIKLKTGSKASKTTKSSLNSDEVLIPSVKFKTLDETTFDAASSILPGTQISTAIKPKKTPTLKVKPVKLPGNSYDSEDPEKEDDPVVEEGIILRFLADESLDYVRAAVENAEKGIHDDKFNLSSLSVTWKDKRRAIVKVNDLMYAAKLVSLPTISEVHKTVDRKNIFKTIDISQILLVVRRIYDENEIYSIPVDKEYGETHPDGLTAPMENCKQRFTKKYEETVIQNVEDEVARLLKLDAEAESSVFEFIDANEEDITPMSVIEGKLRTKMAKKERKRLRKERTKLQESINGNSTNLSNVNNENEVNLDSQFDDIENELDKLMEEEGAEEDDGNENEDEDDEDEDEEEEGEEEEEVDHNREVNESNFKASYESENEEPADEDDDDDDDDDEDEDDDQRNTNNSIGSGSKQHNALLLDEIAELESTIAQKQKDLNKAVNPIMKNRIGDVLGRLQQELEMKKSQIQEEESDGPEDEKSEEEEDNEGDVEGDMGGNNGRPDQGVSPAGDAANEAANDVEGAIDGEEDEDDYDDLF